MLRALSSFMTPRASAVAPPGVGLTSSPGEEEEEPSDVVDLLVDPSEQDEAGEGRIPSSQHNFLILHTQ